MATGFDAREYLEERASSSETECSLQNIFARRVIGRPRAFVEWDSGISEKLSDEEAFAKMDEFPLCKYRDMMEKLSHEISCMFHESLWEIELSSGILPVIMPIYDVRASFLESQQYEKSWHDIKVKYYSFKKSGKKIRTKKVHTGTRKGSLLDDSIETLCLKGYVEEPAFIKVSQPPSRNNDERTRNESFHGFQTVPPVNPSHLATRGSGHNGDMIEHHRRRHDVVQEMNMPALQSDGRISDAFTDPPGQQSIYIPPGDTRLEVYRRTTFENFPQSCPVNRRDLAKSGFYFTGFFDRVKCFSCARTVENWSAGDNPDDLQWHKQNCSFKRGTNSGNVPAPAVFGRQPGHNFSSQMFNQQPQQHQAEQVLEQRDPNSGALIRTIRYPADLPERIRNTGGTFEIGPGNALVIQSGQGRSGNSGLRIGNESRLPATPPPPFRLASVASSDVRRFLSNLYLNRELDRLNSFSRWKISRPNVSPAALARSGFFYLGDLDRTQCFSCGGVLRNWLVEDDPMQEHRSHFGNCPMMLGTETRNVAVPEQDETPDERAINYPCEHPANRHMRNRNNREDTFDRRWPAANIRATPAQIAEAGFFFLGERDRVKCWYCNGGLQNWEYDDIPWVEHAKWFPNCQFLLQQKGQRFVYRHLSINPHLPRPIIAKQEGSPLGEMATNQLPVVQRGHDVPPSGSRARSPTPPIEIIDPQEAERKKQERLNKVMETSDVVKMVQAMGYGQHIVRQLLKAKIEADDIADPDNIYDGVTSLLEDVQKKEEELQQQEDAHQQNERQPTASGLSEPPSFLSSTFSSFQSTMPSSVGAMSSINTAPGSGLALDSDDEDEKMDLYTTEPSELGQQFIGRPQAMLAQTPEDPKSIEKMISQIEDERLCKVCLAEPADMVFIPCSHMSCCMDCTKALRQCPICRTKIEKAIKTYSR